MSAGRSGSGTVRVERCNDDAARLTGLVSSGYGSGISPLRPGGSC